MHDPVDVMDRLGRQSLPFRLEIHPLNDQGRQVFDFANGVDNGNGRYEIVKIQYLYFILPDHSCQRSHL